jgi:hypothetical protein
MLKTNLGVGQVGTDDVGDLSPRPMDVPPELYTRWAGLSLMSTRAKTSAMSSTWIAQTMASLKGSVTDLPRAGSVMHCT